MEKKTTVVAMVAPVPPPYGGIGNWVLLLDEYVRNRDDVQFFHINTAPVARSLDGRSLWDRIVKQGLVMLWLQRELKQLIRGQAVDAVHITTNGQLSIVRDLLMLRTAKKKGIPTVYHIHFGRIPEIAQSDTREWKLIRKAMLMADHVIAIDHKTEAAIRQYAPDVSVCFIPNPFDVRKVSKIEKSKSKNEIVFIGWVVKTKGIEELLQAWNGIRGSYPDWKLRIVGPASEEYLAFLKSTYSQKQVVFEGELPHEDAMQLLSKAALFVLPSYTEGFPNAVLEAMALEKPIIATDVGAIPDMLAGCGIVIPSQDADALERGMEKLLNDTALCANLGKEAKQKLNREYALDKVFAEYMGLWKKKVNEI